MSRSFVESRRVKAAMGDSLESDRNISQDVVQAGIRPGVMSLWSLLGKEKRLSVLRRMVYCVGTRRTRGLF